MLQNLSGVVYLPHGFTRGISVVVLEGGMYSLPDIESLAGIDFFDLQALPYTTKNANIMPWITPLNNINNRVDLYFINDLNDFPA